MYKAYLRKVGGSVMLSVPPAILDLLHLQSDEEVGLTVDNGRLIVEALKKHYSLAELLAQCDSTLGISPEDQSWLGDKPQGQELI